MPKRFTDVDKWTKNKWFRKLPNKYKIFWLFILDNCDAVGVWEEDIELVELLLGESYEKDNLLSKFKDRIKIVCGERKWWIVDFCNFQYGELKEESINNRPHQSYISLLKKHSLWIDYTKTIKSLSYRHKEKDKEKDKDKEQDIKELFETWWLLYPKKIGKGKALESFKIALKKTTIKKLTESVKLFAEAVRGKDKQYIPLPTTWLNQLRWDDDPEAYKEKTGIAKGIANDPKHQEQGSDFATGALISIKDLDPED